MTYRGFENECFYVTSFRKAPPSKTPAEALKIDKPPLGQAYGEPVWDREQWKTGHLVPFYEIYKKFKPKNHVALGIRS